VHNLLFLLNKTKSNSQQTASQWEEEKKKLFFCVFFYWLSANFIFNWIKKKKKYNLSSFINYVRRIYLINYFWSREVELHRESLRN